MPAPLPSVVILRQIRTRASTHTKAQIPSTRSSPPHRDGGLVRKRMPVVSFLIRLSQLVNDWGPGRESVTPTRVWQLSGKTRSLSDVIITPVFEKAQLRGRKARLRGREFWNASQECTAGFAQWPPSILRLSLPSTNWRTRLSSSLCARKSKA